MLRTSKQISYLKFYRLKNCDKSEKENVLVAAFNNKENALWEIYILQKCIHFFKDIALNTKELPPKLHHYNVY